MARKAAAELRADGLKARRGDKILFAGLSFRLTGGELLTVGGANGAGKSTLLRIVAGLCPAHGGTARLAQTKPAAPARPLPLPLFSHYLSEKNAMKPQLSVWRNLAFWHDFLNAETNRLKAAAKREAAEENIARALRAVKMSGYADLPFAVLSTGQKRRIGFCRLLLARRPLWLLDEPTSGLDSGGGALFASLCRRHLRGGGLILAATHLPLGLKAARHIAIADYAPQNAAAQFCDPLDFAFGAEERGARP